LTLVPRALVCWSPIYEPLLDRLPIFADIRFKNQGLDSIEVQDNGSGITPQNYESIALKHHTSKLSNYTDLTTLQTFGFRGEALSSLCALSNFTITTCLAADAPKGTKLEFETSGKLKATSVVASQKGTTVTVENLFNNLPVRRRELERNIKREWNRVVGLLGQYACIQTGVKLSVTQQPIKGKKSTLFSTKGNPTTRENIVNVFGAKTLAALLKLDLKLELEPTSAPSQRWSTQDDGGTKEIHIVGHISRPAYGEGRQTPDRQMFFVNARPCGLPQVAKAFNEVYKSYNSHQSPFIFANIVMDTHLYDVNVSPDKRTILLHDQSRMLEHLKTSLIELFESQDHTVPISQLPMQKQTSYKQLTITRQDMQSRHTTQNSKANTENSDSSDEGSQSASEDRNVDERAPPQKSVQRTGPGTVSRNSLNRDREAVSLITNWLGQKTDDRSVPKEGNIKVVTEKVDGLSREKRRLVDKLGKEKDKPIVEQDTPTSSQESSNDTEPANGIPVAVLDFNRRMAETANESDADRTILEYRELETPIPAITTPTRRPIPAFGGVASSNTRIFRGPTTMATITIGKHTVTSPIGTPSPKKPRTERAASQIAAVTALPSFGSRLSQRFAASTASSGTVDRSDDDEMAESLAEDQDSPLEEATSKGDQSDHSAGEEVTEDEPTETETPMEDSSALLPTKDLDSDYVDEEEKKAHEEAKVVEMIKAAEEDAARPCDENAKRAKLLLKGGARRKESTLQLVQALKTTLEEIDKNLRTLTEAMTPFAVSNTKIDVDEDALDSETAEERLSLTINKSDFADMKIVGQFNLGFILASRNAALSRAGSNKTSDTDDLFIIDQHASDEKYNFERLQATTLVQSQRLVQPKILDLTAVEEEIVMENLAALETNGFIVTVDDSGYVPVGQRCKLVSLPLSRETTFGLSDLEELISLLSEHPAGSIPRPSKVRKMFAMRACRSSIMIGRTLTHKQMGNVVKHMGEIDKPWNCPHGRPTMRHSYNLGVWDDVGWKEGDGTDGGKGSATDWTAFVKKRRRVQT
jgi:DNA mismatch repair protein PMS2